MNSKFQSKLNTFRTLAQDENNRSNLALMGESYKEKNWWVALFLPAIWNLVQGNIVVGLLSLIVMPIITIFFMVFFSILSIGSFLTLSTGGTIGSLLATFIIPLFIPLVFYVVCVYTSYKDCEDLNDGIDQIVMQNKKHNNIKLES